MTDILEDEEKALEFARRVLENCFKFKNPAFSEENEWRLTTGIMYELDDSPDFLYRARDNKIIPYRECVFDVDQKPFAKIVLGPKNQTPKHILERMLVNAGFSDVVVKNSNSTLC